jgi:hypothetical protein
MLSPPLGVTAVHKRGKPSTSAENPISLGGDSTSPQCGIPLLKIEPPLFLATVHDGIEEPFPVFFAAEQRTKKRFRWLALAAGVSLAGSLLNASDRAEALPGVNREHRADDSPKPIEIELFWGLVLLLQNSSDPASERPRIDEPFAVSAMLFEHKMHFALFTPIAGDNPDDLNARARSSIFSHATREIRRETDFDLAVVGQKIDD